MSYQDGTTPKALWLRTHVVLAPGATYTACGLETIEYLFVSATEWAAFTLSGNFCRACDRIVKLKHAVRTAS